MSPSLARTSATPAARLETTASSGTPFALGATRGASAGRPSESSLLPKTRTRSALRKDADDARPLAGHRTHFYLAPDRGHPVAQVRQPVAVDDVRRREPVPVV